ncbi:MAG: hypothetical protein AAB036_11715 [Elusimicrobiota bacterium]
MLTRAAGAAVFALLIGGDVARLGWGAIGLWHLYFPFFWLFILLEAIRSERDVGDEEVFLTGAAMAMFYGGIYAKDLQHGFFPFGIDWLGSIEACFDGGMTAVVSLHALRVLRPESKVPALTDRRPLFLALALGAIGAACVYAVKTVFNFYNAERLLSPSWLLGDVLFGAATWALLRMALTRSRAKESSFRDRRFSLLAAFAVWLPGARVGARLCVGLDLPDAVMYFVVVVWTAVIVRLFWDSVGMRLEEETATRSRPALAAALWRAGAAVCLLMLWGSAREDARMAGAFSAFVDLPSRALFSWAFLTARLKI